MSQILLLLSTLLFTINVFCVQNPMPAFIWSGNQNFLKVSSHEVVDSMSVSVLSDLVKFTSGQSSSVPSELEQYLSPEQQVPEIVVVFVHPELQTSQVSSYGSAFNRKSGGSFENLKTYLSEFSSLTLPYVFKTSGDRQSLVQDLEELNHVHVVDAEDAPAFVHGRSYLFSDKKANILVVKFSSSSSDLATKFHNADNLMGQILERVKKQSGGNFLAILTSNSPAKSSKTMKSIKSQIFTQSKASTKADESSSSSNSSSDDTLYMTPGILSALAAILLFLMISYVGICCTFGLQTPDSFEGEGGYLSAR